VNDFALVPPPRRLEPNPGTCPIQPGLEAALAGWTLGAEPPKAVSARVDRGQVGQAQGYRLTVRPEGMSLLAADPQGLFYGLMTLKQLLRGARAAGRLACLRIEDWPDYPVRGVMLDVSRDRVPTMETLRRLIDLWAELKYNQVQLYTEHTFAYPAHEEVWREASPLTPDEVEELDRCCRARGIELAANQNSFGHMERWLRHARYRPLAEATGGFPDPWGGWRTEPTTLNPLDPRSMELLCGLYDELLPHFSSPLLNVGADEPIDLGHGRCREACRRRGLGRVYLDFLLELHAQVSRRGRVMQFWADVLVHYPELAGEIPRDAIALVWGYERDHPFDRECAIFAEAGLPFYTCPGTSSWNSIGGRWANARANIQAAAGEGLKAGAAGFLLTDWGDNGHWQQLPVPYPAYLYGSAAGWRAGGERDLDLELCLSRHVFRDATGAAARALLILGELAENAIARFHNTSVLGVLLLLQLQPYYREELRKFRGCDFEPERSRIEEALRLLSASEPQAEDAKLLRAELELTARLLAHSARLGRSRFATPGLSVPEIPERERRGLAEELSGLTEVYKMLWLSRSRPGGLADSSGRMLELLQSYGDPAQPGRLRQL
jgi:hexosaminidase